MSLTLYENIKQLITMEGALKKDGRYLREDDLSIIEEASLVFDEEKIIWVGKSNLLPEKFKQVKSVNLDQHIITPEIVDCHTHLVFGGDRAQEYTMRLNGADYEEIGNKGGGILASMKGTREADEEELFQNAILRINNISSYGVGTIEIKSGYGLNYETEKLVSHTIQRLKNHFSPKIKIKNTFMAAHAIPPEYKNSKNYIEEIVIPLMKELNSNSLIDAVDIFHERNYFSKEDVEILFSEAKGIGLNVKSHADEFQDNKGAILAIKYDALSADHLLCTGIDGIKKLSESNTVATLLPGTGLFLGKPQANARLLLDNGCKVAIGSDYNPGSCHCDNVLLLASIAAPQYKMNIAELWSSITLNAAHALGIHDQGAIIKDLKPRFSIFSTTSLNHITYNWGKNFSVNL